MPNALALMRPSRAVAMFALARAVEAWDPVKHPRIPKGLPDAGQFLTLDERMQVAFHGGGNDPLKGFSRPSLLKAAKDRGIYVRRGASEEELRSALEKDIKAKGVSDKAKRLSDATEVAEAPKLSAYERRVAMRAAEQGRLGKEFNNQLDSGLHWSTNVGQGARFDAYNSYMSGEPPWSIADKLRREADTLERRGRNSELSDHDITGMLRHDQGSRDQMAIHDAQRLRSLADRIEAKAGQGPSPAELTKLTNAHRKDRIARLKDRLRNEPNHPNRTYMAETLADLQEEDKQARVMGSKPAAKKLDAPDTPKPAAKKAAKAIKAATAPKKAVAKATDKLGDKSRFGVSAVEVRKAPTKKVGDLQKGDEIYVFSGRYGVQGKPGKPGGSLSPDAQVVTVIGRSADGASLNVRTDVGDTDTLFGSGGGSLKWGRDAVHVYTPPSKTESGQTGQMGRGKTVGPWDRPDAPDELAAELHDEWRKTRLSGGSYEPRMKTTTDKRWAAAHGTDQVDIANTRFEGLPSDWQAENMAAAKVVVDLVRKRGTVDIRNDADRVEVGSVIHAEWLKRNEWAKGGELDVPFERLPRSEQDKDIAQYAAAGRVFGNAEAGSSLSAKRFEQDRFGRAGRPSGRTDRPPVTAVEIAAGHAARRRGKAVGPPKLDKDREAAEILKRMPQDTHGMRASAERVLAGKATERGVPITTPSGKAKDLRSQAAAHRANYDLLYRNNPTPENSKKLFQASARAEKLEAIADALSPGTGRRSKPPVVNDLRSARVEMGRLRSAITYPGTGPAERKKLRARLAELEGQYGGPSTPKA